ncbi:hypothetical protein LV779_22045 [Streptomyces thinghirensis]|nr:hypothetical protein [Streptomyces thinghirensis]
MNRDSLIKRPPQAPPCSPPPAPPSSDAVVFELGGAMRGSVYVTGTHHPQHWDRFTAVRACLGPVNAYRQTTAPGRRAAPRLARGHSVLPGEPSTLSPPTSPAAPGFGVKFDGDRRRARVVLRRRPRLHRRHCVLAPSTWSCSTRVPGWHHSPPPGSTTPPACCGSWTESVTHHRTGRRALRGEGPGRPPRPARRVAAMVGPLRAGSRSPRAWCC